MKTVINVGRATHMGQREGRIYRTCCGVVGVGTRVTENWRHVDCLACARTNHYRSIRNEDIEKRKKERLKMVPRDTATLDQLYLEWSQFTDARTVREIKMDRELQDLRNVVYAVSEPGETLLDTVTRLVKGAG